ncbi:MAG: hypothetical protein KDN05_15180, partial [Verrucomicrobiae bacterium]|nr:hypothetical protein [Verrucomicrobiae bacterium]
STVFVTTANRMPKPGLSGPEAVKTVREAAAMPADQLLAPHRDGWHAFYRKSFVSIPDARLQSFYWIQLYKIGSATREGGRALGNSGPWFRLNQWPQIWWNLNVQITYWMFDPSNHTDLGRTLVDEIDRNFDHLFSIYGGKKEMGDFIWVLHNYWLHYRYLGDWDTLRAKWLPKAEKSLASFQSNFLKETADGNLELAPMGSPEFLHGSYFKEVKDTNYNLALIRWLLGTMIDVSTKTGGSPQVQDWQKLLGRLPAAPLDAHGLMIGRGQSFDRSHRHFSHIIGFYPLFVLNPDDPADRALVDKSLRHFLDIKNKDGTQDRCGYTLTCAASQVAMMGRGDETLQYLNDFLDNKILKMATFFASRVLPNTMYVETKGRNPTIESPLGAANATLEMLLQSWGAKVRIFPAMPTAWKDAVFHQLRAQGAFLVSAERKNGKTEWVAVESLAGEPLVLKVPDWSGPLVVSSEQDLKVTETAPGEYQVNLKKGGSAAFSKQPLEGKPVIKPLPDQSGGKVFYGLRKGENLKENQTWPEYHLK